MKKWGEQMKYSREETEIKKEILFRMYERGFEYKDMADIVGISCGTAYLWIREERKHRKVEREECVKNRVKGWNTDRHACKTCTYRHKAGSGCDYYVQTDHVRGCNPEDCYRYMEDEDIERVL